MRGVVAAVCEEAVGPVAAAAPERRDRVDEVDEVAAVVVVGRTQMERQRQAASVAGEVQLRAGTAAVCRAFADLPAPLFAGTIVESTIARCQSIASSVASRCCSLATSCGQTPARCHSSSRRQHVFPDGFPGCRGSARQGIPQRNTERIPSRHARSS